MKVLLPLDGSSVTKRMLSTLAAHDELLGGGHELILLTVVPFIPARLASFMGRAAIDVYYSEQAAKVLRPATKFAARQGWRFRAQHVTGHAAEAIANLAVKERVDLIVIGTHGRSALRNVVLGSVASGVLARCQMPVLLIR